MNKKYKVLESFAGSPDGFTVINYVAGDVVELSASLAAAELVTGRVREIKTRQRKVTGPNKRAIKKPNRSKD